MNKQIHTIHDALFIRRYITGEIADQNKKINILRVQADLKIWHTGLDQIASNDGNRRRKIYHPDNAKAMKAYFAHGTTRPEIVMVDKNFNLKYYHSHRGD